MTLNSHDVCLVYSSYSSPTFLPGQSEGIISDPQGIVSGDDLETFHYPRYTLHEDGEENNT